MEQNGEYNQEMLSQAEILHYTENTTIFFRLWLSKQSGGMSFK